MSNTRSERTSIYKYISLYLIAFLISNITSKITINSPSTLAEKFPSPIDAKYSIFGSIKFGFQLNGRLYYDPTNQETDYACKPISSLQIQNDDVDSSQCLYPPTK